MPVTLTTPVSIGTIDAIRVDGYTVRGLYDTANAFIRLHLQRMIGAGVHQDFVYDVFNGQPLKNVQTEALAQTASNWATQLATVILTATGNPKDEIEAWMVLRGVITGVAT